MIERAAERERLTLLVRSVTKEIKTGGSFHNGEKRSGSIFSLCLLFWFQDRACPLRPDHVRTVEKGPWVDAKGCSWPLFFGAEEP